MLNFIARIPYIIYVAAIASVLIGIRQIDNVEVLKTIAIISASLLIAVIYLGARYVVNYIHGYKEGFKKGFMETYKP